MPAWTAGMAVMLLATTAVTSPDSTTASKSHGEIWQSITDESFDNTVVLQDPMLDPALPPPTSGWNPDRLDEWALFNDQGGLMGSGGQPDHPSATPSYLTRTRAHGRHGRERHEV